MLRAKFDCQKREAVAEVEQTSFLLVRLKNANSTQFLFVFDLSFSWVCERENERKIHIWICNKKYGRKSVFCLFEARQKKEMAKSQKESAHAFWLNESLLVTGRQLCSNISAFSAFFLYLKAIGLVWKSCATKQRQATHQELALHSMRMRQVVSGKQTMGKEDRAVDLTRLERQNIQLKRKICRWPKINRMRGK